MKQIVLILAFFTAHSACQVYDAAWIAFIGSSKTDFQNFTTSSLASSVIGTSYFSLTKPTVFITHGWQATFDDDLAVLQWLMHF